jgi:exodeoxyribonuclease VII small subunit
MPDEPEPNFEQALTQIEQVVLDLERGERDLTTALANYEIGVRMLTLCYRFLDQAERSAALLTGVDEQGSPITAPFDSTATIERENSSTGPADLKSIARDSMRTNSESTSKQERQVGAHDDQTEVSEPPF